MATSPEWRKTACILCSENCGLEVKVTGNRIEWVKTYDGTAGVSHSVSYSGTLDRGQTQTFTRKALYLAVKKPKNVVVKVNGNRYPLSASGELMIAAATSVG